MIHDCSFVLCWLFMSPLFVLNSWTEHCSSDKSSTFCRFCSFPAFLHIWTLSSSDCMILRSIFSHWGQLMDSNTTIKKGSNIHWCSRRTHDALRTGWRFPTFFFCWNIYIFPFITALRKQQKVLACFPEDKLSTIYLDLQIQKVFTPPALNASCVLLEHQWMFEPFLIVVFESINCPQCEKMDLLKEDLSEEQCSVQLFRTNKGLMNNQHKTKEQSWIIQVTSHSIKNQGFPNFCMPLYKLMIVWKKSELWEYICNYFIIYYIILFFLWRKQVCTSCCSKLVWLSWKAKG